MPNGKLPEVGVKFTTENLNRFKQDMDGYNRSLAQGQKGTADFVKEAQRMDKGLGPLPQSFQKVSGELRRMKDDVDGLEGRARSLGAGLDQTSESVRSWGESWAMVGVAIAGAAFVTVQGFRAIKEAMEEIERVEAPRGALIRLGAQVGIASREIVQAAEEASRYTVEEYDIIIAANKELLAGHKELAQSIPQLMDLAYATALATGRDVEDQFRAIVRAVREGKPELLEQADIYMDVNGALETYAKSQGRTVEKLSETERELVTLNTVLAETPGYIDKVGTAFGSNLGSLTAFTQEAQTLKNTLLALGGRALLGGLEMILGKEPAGAFADWTSSAETQLEALRLLDEIKRTGDEAAIARARELMRSANFMKMSYDEVVAIYREMLGIGPPVSGAAPTIGVGMEAAMAAAAAEARKKLLADERKARDEELNKMLRDYQRKAETWAFNILEFVGEEEALRLFNEYINDIYDTMQDMGDEALTLKGRMFIDKSIIQSHEELLKDLREVNRESKKGASYWREYNKALLLSSKGMGDWAKAYTVEHGKTPLEAYARHAEPLVAATMDRLWGEQFAAREGRAPTQEEWETHWYQQWMPLEMWPGGPIMAATGPLAEQAKKMIGKEGLEGLGDVFHDSWLKSKDLAPALESVKTQSEILSAYYAEHATPSVQGFKGAVDDATAALIALGLIHGPTGGEGEEGEEGGDTSNGSTQAALEALLKWLAKMTASEEYQAGGVVRRTGLALVHAGEVVIPLVHPARTVELFAGVLRQESVALPVRTAAGSVSVGPISVAVTVNGGPATADTAAAVGRAVAREIRNRTGTELRRAARQLGI